MSVPLCLKHLCWDCGRLARRERVARARSAGRDDEKDLERADSRSGETPVVPVKQNPRQ